MLRSTKDFLSRVHFEKQNSISEKTVTRILQIKLMELSGKKKSIWQFTPSVSDVLSWWHFRGSKPDPEL